jgi:mannose-6-phosphate isomerase-like protein (cupin superfamily)
MKHVQTARRRNEFARLLATREAQAILMTLAPGEASEDEPANEHPRCEQWMFVLSGRGQATVRRTGGRSQTVSLSPGSLLVVLKREPHQIKNTGAESLRTINLYVPPAYGRDGEPLPSATPKRRG